MNSSKTHFRILALPATIILLCVAIIAFPIRVNKEIPVFNDSGSSCVVEVNLKINSSLLFPDTISGYVMLNGEKYISAQDTSVIDYDVNLHDLFSEPMSRTFVFFKEGRSTDLDSEKMLVSMKDYKLTDVSFLLISDGVSEIYATPGFYD